MDQSVARGVATTFEIIAMLVIALEQTGHLSDFALTVEERAKHVEASDEGRAAILRSFAEGLRAGPSSPQFEVIKGGRED